MRTAGLSRHTRTPSVTIAGISGHDHRNTHIGRPEVQAFAGALLGNRSTKGVFITTSKFTRDAIEFARSVPNAAIILIDGMQLAEYMYQYGLGVEIRDEFAIKDLDESYWDELADGVPSSPAQA